MTDFALQYHTIPLVHFFTMTDQFSVVEVMNWTRMIIATCIGEREANARMPCRFGSGSRQAKRELGPWLTVQREDREGVHRRLRRASIAARLLRPEKADGRSRPNAEIAAANRPSESALGTAVIVRWASLPCISRNAKHIWTSFGCIP